MDLSYKKACLYSLYDDIKISKLKNNSYNLDSYEYTKVVEYFEKNKIWFCLDWTENYHYRLEKIKSKPYIVYYIWNYGILNSPNLLSIVWPRKMSSYAEKVLEELFSKLSRFKDIVTVSWLANWVDKKVHNLSIKYNIPTISVLWWGFNHFLNSSDRSLINDIIANNWLILSEFKIKQKPTHYTFPQRNRIIAWISDFLFLPEAWEKSGSLITVDFANKSNVPVYATPNSIYSVYSSWINEYIWKWKVNLVYDLNLFVEDSLKLNTWSEKTIKNSFFDSLSKEDQLIVNSIINWNNTLDLLVIDTGFDDSSLLNKLSMLEINWYIFQSYPWHWDIVK